MPLVNGLYEVVFNHRSVKEVIRQLMMSEQSNDVEFEVLDQQVPR